MINTNVSALTANQTYMDNNANNIANVNTDKYRPSDTDTPMATSTKSDDNGSQRSQTNLVKEITDQITIENFSRANVQAIKTQDNMIGSLLDIKA